MPTFKDLAEWFKAQPRFVQVAASAMLLWFIYLGGARYFSTWPFAQGEIRISIESARQFEMLKAHLTEEPAKEFVFYDDSTGAAKSRLYASDGAILHLRTAPGAKTSVYWQQRPMPESVSAFHLVAPQIMPLFTPLYAETVPQGCIPVAAHGIAAKEWREVLEDGSAHLWQAWADGCSGYYVQFPDGSIAYDSDGYPIFLWVTCSGAH